MANRIWLAKVRKTLKSIGIVLFEIVAERVLLVESAIIYNNLAALPHAKYSR